MSLLRRSRPAVRERSTAPAVEANIADIAHEAQRAKQANQYLYKVLERNHITVKIYSQLGGKPKRKRA